MHQLCQLNVFTSGPVKLAIVNVRKGMPVPSGHPSLAVACHPVVIPDPKLDAEIVSLYATLADFRWRNGFGRAMAAPSRY